MGKKKKKKSANTLVNNKKAFHNYAILETIEAGIELKGTEVKSCREGLITISEAHIRIDNGEIFLMNAHIAHYKHGNQFNHDPLRKKRLLMHKKEILKLSIQTREAGFTLMPISFYLKFGRVKVGVGVAKGKSHSDKRDVLRKKQDSKDAKRAMSKYV